MRSKILSIRTLGIAFLIGFTLYPALLYFKSQSFGLHQPDLLVENTAPLPQNNGLAPAETGLGLPVRLKIPKIAVDADVEGVGVTDDGQVGVPKGPSGVAWFELGPRPGDNGNALISGHYGWKNNIPAVFDNLHKLARGDEIYVEDEKGQTITFVVRETKSYGQYDNASEVFGQGDGESHLNLVTCEGVWSKENKSYSGRFVVFTDRQT